MTDAIRRAERCSSIRASRAESSVGSRTTASTISQDADTIGIAAEGELVQPRVGEQPAFDEAHADPPDQLRAESELARQTVDADVRAGGPHHDLDAGLLLRERVELEAPGAVDQDPVDAVGDGDLGAQQHDEPGGVRPQQKDRARGRPELNAVAARHPDLKSGEHPEHRHEQDRCHSRPDGR